MPNYLHLELFWLKKFNRFVAYNNSNSNYKLKKKLVIYSIQNVTHSLNSVLISALKKIITIIVI
jgi:hypothetical protein